MGHPADIDPYLVDSLSLSFSLLTSDTSTKNTVQASAELKSSNSWNYNHKQLVTCSNEDQMQNLNNKFL